jgi:hypothetical protein
VLVEINVVDTHSPFTIFLQGLGLPAILGV